MTPDTTNQTNQTNTTTEQSALDGQVFLDELERRLPEIDACLDTAEVQLGIRPDYATQLFLDEFDFKIDGEPLPKGPEIKYHPSGIFRPFFQVARAWYERTYGAALNPPDRIEAMCLIGRMPYLLNIPATHTRVEVEGETLWYSWPTEVRADELPLTWVMHGPRFEAMPIEARGETEQLIREIVKLVRTGRLNVVTASCSGETERQLRGQILAHVECAARLLVDSRRAGNRGLAYWEVHQAIEQSLKLYIRQQPNSLPPHIHEMRDLATIAAQSGGLQVDRTLLELIPRRRDVIELRAGERVAGSMSEAFAMYMAGLRLFESITAALHRKVNIHDVGLLLKKPPYV